MTGFHDVLFPLDVSRGAKGGPQFSTRIVSTASGYEYRNVEWSAARGRWNVAFGVRTDTDLATLIAFFHARQGRAYAFRFRDPLDHTATAQACQTNAAGAVQLAKLYVSGSTTYVRFISLPVSGTVTGLGGGSLDYSTGILTGVTAGTTLSFTFDCKARFDTDHLDGTVFRDGLAGYDDIPVIEVR